VTRRRGRRRKQLLDDLGDRRGYCHLKEEALDRIKWRNRFGRGCGPVVWQITDDDDQSKAILHIMHAELLQGDVSRPYTPLNNKIREPFLTRVTISWYFTIGFSLESTDKNLGRFSSRILRNHWRITCILLYEILKMVIRVTETCRCNKHSSTAEHLRNCAFVGFYKKISWPYCTVWNTQKIIWCFKNGENHDASSRHFLATCHDSSGIATVAVARTRTPEWAALLSVWISRNPWSYIRVLYNIYTRG
jgi:hypothetical protein